MPVKKDVAKVERGKLQDRYYKRCPKIAEQVEMLAAGGMTKHMIRKFFGLTESLLDEFYTPELENGKANLYRTGITALVGLIEQGNEKAILLFAKAHLGWVEAEKKLQFKVEKRGNSQVILLDAPPVQTLDEIKKSR